MGARQVFFSVVGLFLCGVASAGVNLLFRDHMVFPAENLKISSLLAGSPKVFGYLYGHHHRFETHYAIENYSQGSRVLRTVGVGSFALDGDVGYVVVKTTPKGADMRFVQNGFWFPAYRPPEERPQLWHEFARDNNGRKVRFPFS